MLVPWICRGLASWGARQAGWFSDHWGSPWAHPVALSLVVPAPHLWAPELQQHRLGRVAGGKLAHSAQLGPRAGHTFVALVA